MARITINGVSLNPIVQAQALGVAGLTSKDASKSNYILVQTAAPALTPPGGRAGEAGCRHPRVCVPEHLPVRLQAD